jgi:cytochrome c biogenesis protein CcmG/thiol:disulfide interchange protein DsbE
MRTLFVLIGVVIVAVLVMLFYAQSGGGSGRLAVSPAMLAGAPAASFTVQNVTGRPDSLTAYRGKVVLVNLWATWCPPCREEMPALEKLYRAYRSKGFIVLGIDQGESANVAASFARKLGVSFPLLIDGQQQYGRAYAAQGLPTSVLVDRSGRIVRGVDGEMTIAQMRSLVTPTLDAK